MINFVEDLGLAGIRFVYFSPAPERESKAYAERLGLEIDWNSCIILSKDTTGKGYLALHDMKAQLPRGVGTIREHIKNVDDVPLQVSLFAECEPQTPFARDARHAAGVVPLHLLKDRINTLERA